MSPRINAPGAGSCVFGNVVRAVTWVQPGGRAAGAVRFQAASARLPGSDSGQLRPAVEGDRHGLLRLPGLLQRHFRYLRRPAPGLDSEIGPWGFPFSRTGDSSLQCEGKHPRSRSVSALGAPVAGGDACLTRRCVPVWLVAPYWPGPAIVMVVECESIRSS